MPRSKILRGLFVLLALDLGSTLVPAQPKPGVQPEKPKRNLADLVEGLKSSDFRERSNAVTALDELGLREPFRVAPAVAGVLKHEDADVRWDAIQILRKLGPNAYAAVSGLTDALRDKEARIRREAAVVLGRIGVSARPAVPALIATLNEKEVQSSAAYALVQIGPDARAVPGLISLLKNRPRGFDYEYFYRVTIKNVFLRVGPPAVPALMELLTDEKSATEDIAASILIDLRSAARKAVPDLVKLLKADNPLTRTRAARILGRMAHEPAATTVVPALVESLKDSDPGVRSNAAIALGNFPKQARSAVPLLIKLLKDPEEGVRSGAAQALGYIGTPEAVTPLQKAQKDPALYVRLDASIALARLEVENDAQAAVLSEAFKDLKYASDLSYVLVNVHFTSLGTKARRPFDPAFVELLKHKDAKLRERALEWLGTGAKAALPALLESLKDKDDKVRAEAFRALGRLGSEAKAAVPVLRKALQDELEKSKGGRVHFFVETLGAIGPEAKAAVPELIAVLKRSGFEYECAEALGRIGPEAKEAVPFLLPLLKRDFFKFDYPGARGKAAEALKRIGRDGKRAVPALVQALKDPNEDVRKEVKFALEQFGGEAIPFLIESLKDKSPRQRTEAVEVLIALGSPKEALPGLIAALREKDYFSHYRIGECLHQIGPSAVEPLLEMLLDQDPSVRANAASALRHFPKTETVLPALTKLLKDKDARVRHNTIQILAVFGAEAVPALLGILKEGQERDQELALYAFERLGPAAASAVADVIKSLNSPGFFVQAYAANALGKIGPAAKTAVPALIDAIKNKNFRPTTAAIWALGEIGPEARAAIPVVLDFAKNSKAAIDFRRTAVAALGKLGPDARSAIPFLTEALADAGLRSTAAIALLRLDPKSPAALEALIQDLSRDGPDDRYFRLFTLRTVAELGPAAKGAEAAIRDALYEDDLHLLFILYKPIQPDAALVRSAAAFALFRIGCEGKDLLSILLRSVHNKDASVRQEAIFLLGQLGPAAKAAVPDLTALLKDRDPSIRSLAETALQKIGSKEKE